MEMATLNVSTTYEETSSSDYELEPRAVHTPQIDVIHEYEEIDSSNLDTQHAPRVTQVNRKNTRNTDKFKIVLGIIVGVIAIMAGVIVYTLSEMQKIKNDYYSYVLENEDKITNLQNTIKELQITRNSYVLENENKMTNLQNSIKENARHLAEAKEEYSLKVAVTACAWSETYKKYVPIPFPNVRTSYGITNLSTLKTNGQFTCESDGLYLVSVTIVSKQKYGKFNINKNNNILVFVYLQDKDSGKYYSGSNTAVVLMSVNDTISVRPWYDNSYVLGNHYSCITVVKVK